MAFSALKRRALLSVFDKTGLIDLARVLVEEFALELLSTGGTAKALRQAGLPVTLVEDVTGFGEMLDGRVKTLHPAIHAALLADRDNPEHMQQLARAGIVPIDVVVVNLYPFEKTIARAECTLAEALEMIDIGGVTLLRAAAKNHKDVLVVSDVQQYPAVRRVLHAEGPMASYARKAWAAQAFSQTATYDRRIATYLAGLGSSPPPGGQGGLRLEQQPLRYGENQHQTARVEVLPTAGRTIGEAATELSYNNYLDADAAGGLCADLWRELGQPNPSAKHAVVFVKHTNPCGVGVHEDPVEAYRRAYLADPNAAMGGILACSFPITVDFAEVVMTSLERWGKAAGAGAFFVEVWVAPAFEPEAVKLIRERKQWGARVRLREETLNTLVGAGTSLARSVAAGVLVQSPDHLGLNEGAWRVVTKRAPTEQELADLRLAWLVAKHTKSNAISICKDGFLIGNGAGQMSRVTSCRLATWLAKENGHEALLRGAAAASDAFFPFRDGPDILAEAGITAIIQPGGSKRDEETIAACEERGLAMIFTGTRHFRH